MQILPETKAAILELNRRLTKCGDANFNRFEDIAVDNRLHIARDMHVFLMLALIVPTVGKNLILSGNGDRFWLSIDLVALADRICDTEIMMLWQCGVSGFDPETSEIHFGR